MATQGIRVHIYGDYDNKQIDKAMRDLQGLKTQTRGFGQTMRSAGSQMSSFGRSMTAGVTLPIIGLGFAFVEMARGAEDANVANAKLGNVLEGMGYGEATARVSEYAESLERSLAVDADVIKATQTKLATFSALASTTNKVGGAFDRATVAALDLAAAGFGSAETNAVQLGKALQDPIKGITALARAGVTFTEQEKEKIKALVESGRLLAAQEIILAAVEKQVGGTAKAGASGFERMKLSLMQVSDAIGNAVLPLIQSFADVLTGTILPMVLPLIERFSAAWKGLAPQMQAVVVIAGVLVAAIGPVLMIVGSMATAISAIAGVFAAVSAPVLLVVAAIAAVVAILVLLWMKSEEFRDAVIGAWNAIYAAIQGVVDNVKAKLDENRDAVDSLVNALSKVWEFLSGTLIPILASFYGKYLSTLVTVIGAVIGWLVQWVAMWVRVYSAIFQAGVAVVTFVQGAIAWFTQLVEFITGLPEKITSAASGMWSGIVDSFRSAINTIIGIWNAMSFTFPSFDGDWNGPLPGGGFTVGGWTLDTPDIPKLAAGGITTGPTLAMIGEAGQEAVIPLDRLGDLGGSGGGNTYNIALTVPLGTPMAEAGRIVVEQVKAYERFNGNVFSS